MNKEEILQKSRAEGKDEGAEFISNKGRRYGVEALVIMFVILAVFNLYQGQNCHQILAMLFSYLGLESYGMYKADKKKIRLIGMVVGIIAGVVFGILHIVSVLK